MKLLLFVRLWCLTFSNSFPIHCLGNKLHYCHTTSLPHYITATLHYYHTTLLPHYITATLHYYHTTLRPHYITTTLHYYHTTLLPHYITTTTFIAALLVHFMHVLYIQYARTCSLVLWYVLTNLSVCMDVFTQLMSYSLVYICVDTRGNIHVHVHTVCAYVYVALIFIRGRHVMCTWHTRIRCFSGYLWHGGGAISQWSDVMWYFSIIIRIFVFVCM
jgi:hypothetical protein